jgi:hypothetical protein
VFFGLKDIDYHQLIFVEAIDRVLIPIDFAGPNLFL